MSLAISSKCGGSAVPVQRRGFHEVRGKGVTAAAMTTPRIVVGGKFRLCPKEGGVFLGLKKEMIERAEKLAKKWNHNP